MKYRDRAVVTAAAALALVGLCYQVPATAGLVGTAEVSQASETWVDPADALGDVQSLAPRLKSLFGERFGFFEIVRSQGPVRFEVGVVGPSGADRTAAAALSDSVTVVASQRSQRDLDALKLSIRDVMVGKNIDAVLLSDERSGTLTLYAEQLSDVDRLAFESAVPPGVLAISVGGGFTYGLAHTTRADLPYEGGLLVAITSAAAPSEVLGGQRQGGEQRTGHCTSNFWTNHDYGFGDVFNYGVMAGHCGDTGADVVMGGKHLSGVGTNSFYRGNPINSDAARFFLPSQYTSWPPRVFTGVEGTSGHRTVKGRFGNDALVSGLRLCFQGISSINNNCGNIVARDVPITLAATDTTPLRTLSHAWCIDFPGLEGDSGGPVYHVNPDQSAIAAGVVSGIGATTTTSFTCFSSSEWVQNDLNVNTLLAP